MSENIWWQDHDKRVSLAYWLMTKGRFDSISDVVYYIEKPYKWDNDYQEMKEEEKLKEIELAKKT